MKISRKSWHYRLYNLLRNLWTIGPTVDYVMDRTPLKRYTPESICSYFWAYLSMLVFLPVILVGLLFLGILLLVVFSFMTVLDWGMAKRNPKSPNQKEPTPSVLVEGFKSFKNRHCSRITLVD